MQMTTLGRTNIRVSRICFSIAASAPSLRLATVLRNCLGDGVNFVDVVARCKHSDAASAETALGQWIEVDRDHRGLIALASGLEVGPDARVKDVLAACDGSLKRLKTDWIDLAYLGPLSAQVHAEIFYEAAVELSRQGKALYFANTNTPAWMLAREQIKANRQGSLGMSAYGVLYSPGIRSAELEIIPACEAMGISIVASTPSSICTHVDAAHEARTLAEASGVDPSIIESAWVLRALPSSIVSVGFRSEQQVRDSSWSTMTRLSEFLHVLDGVARRPLGPAPDAYRPWNLPAQLPTVVVGTGRAARMSR